MMRVSEGLTEKLMEVVRAKIFEQLSLFFKAPVEYAWLLGWKLVWVAVGIWLLTCFARCAVGIVI